MLIECTKTPRAYVDEMPENAHTQFNLNTYVELIERPTPGGDGLPIIVPAGCGYVFEWDLDKRLWDVNTQVDDNGNEVIVERHASIVCPRCGSVADIVSEAVEDEELIYVDKTERARAVAIEDLLLSDAELQKLKPAVIEKIIRSVMGAADCGYTHVTEGAVALSAATAKTVLAAKAGSAAGLQLAHVTLGFDGVTASAVPVLVEVCYATFASNSPGTNSTGTSERQEYGRVISADWTGGRNWTSEPTTLTVLEEKLIGPYGSGLTIYDFPLGVLPDSAVSEGFAVRCTAPASVNVRATMKVRRA